MIHRESNNVRFWHKADRTTNKITLLAPTSKKQRILHNARSEAGLRAQRPLTDWSQRSYATARAMKFRNVTGHLVLACYRAKTRFL